MSDTTTTFIDFIKEHSIQIPLIQRDYVQGLALNDKMKEKRDEFVKKLLDAILPDGKPYTLDFIYGAHESYDDNINSHGAPFLPLDGQQRLTTLYLLHWILAVKTNKEGCWDFVLDLLKKFAYKTRITSDKFCRRLLNSTFDSCKSLHKQIKDKTWYVSLETDPTIIAIMEMIKQIEDTLSTVPYEENINKLSGHLFNADEGRIKFSLLDMERYHLTDGLYVKMNARGKELTTFENWKADFINLISDNEVLKDRFTSSIEHEWNDLFWKDVYKDYVMEVSQKPDENEKLKVKYPCIDEHFMNYFINLSRLFFFLETTSDKPKAEDFNGHVWSTTEKLYGKNSTLVTKLFGTFDTLVEIEKTESLESFFNNLFHTQPSTGWEHHCTQVRLFDCESVNLFKSCFESSEFSWQHVMLYALLKYCTKYKVFKVTEELKNYVRICRDYLYQHNYLDNGKVTIVAQIRVVEMKTYEKVFDYLCSNLNSIESLKMPFSGEDSKYIEIEQKKKGWYCGSDDIKKLFCKIEDMSYTHGNIGAFTDILQEGMKGSLQCDIVWDAIFSFINASGLQKVQLFLAYNYEGMIIGNDCAYGKRVFIGGDFGHLSRWEVHFRKNENKLGIWTNNYVKAYINSSDIKDLIDTEKTKIRESPKTIRDYMLKYEQVVAAQLRSPNEKDYAPFYYAMPNPWQDMDAIVIHSFSSHPLGNSYQTCPMANAVARNISNIDNKYMGWAGHGSNKEGIKIHNEDWSKTYLSIYFAENEWHVTEGYSLLSSGLQNRLKGMNKEDGTTYYRLLPINNRDLIESATDFIQEVVSEFKEKGII